MKKFILINLFLWIVFFAFAQKPDGNFIDKMALSESRNFELKSAFIENPSYSSSDLIYQRMEWNIDPAILYISGNVTSYIKSKTQNLSEIEFDLHSALTVDSIIQNKKKINFNRNSNRITIPFTNPLNIDEIDSVTIFYQGEPPTSTGFGSFTKTIHAQIPNIWTLSEPYGAMEWWPCKQSLVDKIDSIDIIVTCPSPYRTASNGILVSEKEVGRNRIMHWKHRYPIATYLVAISVTNYEEYSEFVNLNDGRQIEILNYIYPENLDTAKVKTKVTVELMELFNELIGEYPFADEKYGHAQFGWGGGMEHQTMSFMGGFGFELIAHELAHQWFGDYITVGTWQDIWLNEGFATYLSGLAYEHLLDGVWWPVWRKLNVERITSSPDGSVFVKDTTDVNQIFSGRLSYSKGAYLLHMIRGILGDDIFFEAIQTYFKSPLVANGFARNSDFINILESVSDTSFTEFFNDWYYNEGFPIYTIQFSQVGSSSLKLKLSQTPSHSSVDFFEMPVPIRLYNSNKTDSIDFTLNNKTNNEEFVVEPSFEVSELKIDPEYWLLSKTNSIVKVPWIPTSDEILIYPNPFTEKISVFVANGIYIKNIELYSHEGKRVKQIARHETTFDWSDLPKGVYILKLETKDKTMIKKMVKH